MLPGASPLVDVACPIGGSTSPHLTTPAWVGAGLRADVVAGDGTSTGACGSSAAVVEDEEEDDDYDPDRNPRRSMSMVPPLHNFGSKPSDALRGGPDDFLGGLTGLGQWAWEPGSEVQSSGGRSSASRMSSSTGDGLVPGLTDGQRLNSVSPSSVPTTGGRLVVNLRREVPQGYWDTIWIVLVAGPVQHRLKPTGIKKGKKLCIEVPDGLAPGDYDIRLSFGEKIIHGAIPFTVLHGDVAGASACLAAASDAQGPL